MLQRLLCWIFGHKTNVQINPMYYRRMPPSHPMVKKRHCCVRCGQRVDLLEIEKELTQGQRRHRRSMSHGRR